MEKMNRKKPLVFLDVSIDGDPFERMTFELFSDVAPKTAESFRALCTGEKGFSPKTGKPLHYKGTFFHRIIKGFLAQGGDFLRQDGKYGESIYDGNFQDESPKLKHDGPGLLSVAISDAHQRGSLFSVTFKADHHLDRKCIVFGKLVGGHEVLNKIENAGDKDGRPAVTVKIFNSGELCDDKKKGNKLKVGKDAMEGNCHEVERKEKRNKSSKRKRKRRYYTSESDSSTDTDLESSDTDSDSDSYASSLSDTSSSSDDRRRKRKRSKRNRHRRGKKDRRREKRRKKRRDKKSRWKSRRDGASDSDSDSKSGSSSKDHAEVGVLDRKPKSSGNQSFLVEERETATVNHKKGESVYLSEREEGEFPSENGDHQSNGIGIGMGSDRSADKHPDVVDDLPTKSRSRSLSPRRAMSRSSMSTSPRRSSGKSPGIGSKHKRSRSPTVSKSPQQISTRSNSAVSSGNSSSPIRSSRMSKKNRSVSMSPPAGSYSQRSHSRSSMISPPRRMVTRSPPRTSSRRSSLKSESCSPVKSSRRSLSRSSGKPSRRSPSRSLVRFHISRSPGRAPPRRSPSPSPVSAPTRTNRHINSRSPLSAGHRARSRASERSKSSSRSPSIDRSPKRIRRGRGFSDRYSYGHRYRSHSRSRDHSPLRSYRYPSYRRSPRCFRSPPQGRTPPRYRGRRSRTRSPIRYGNRRFSRNCSPIGSRSPAERYRASPRPGRRRSPSQNRRSRSRSGSPSSHNSQSSRHTNNDNSKSSSGSPPGKTRLVSYGDGSPDTGHD